MATTTGTSNFLATLGKSIRGLCLATVLIGWVFAGESSDPKPHEEAKKCEASDVTHKYVYTFPEMKAWAEKLTKALKEKPGVKEFSITLATTVELQQGEKCCPGDELPTDYYSGNINLKGMAVAEFFLPPPFAYSGTVSISASSPNLSWFGLPPKEIFRLYGGIAAGIFGGGNGEVAVTSNGSFGECNCMTLSLGGKVVLKLGLAAQGRLTLSIAGDLVFDGAIGAEGSFNGIFELAGKVNVGSGEGCDKVVCWGYKVGEVKTGGKLYLDVTGYGRWEYEVEGPVLFKGWSGGPCKPPEGT